MIDIKVIIDGAKDFHSFAPESVKTPNWELLEKKIKEWVGGERHHLVSHITSIGQVLILVGERATPQGAPLIHTYTLCRFFEIGDKWEVSVDFQNIDAEEMMHELMNNTN